MKHARPSVETRALRVTSPPPLPALRATALEHLPPEMARWSPPITKVARSLRDYGVIREVGRVGMFDDGQGAGTTTLRLDFPGLAESGGQSGINFPIDLEAARYLPPRTRVRLTLEILRPDEEE